MIRLLPLALVLLATTPAFAEKIVLKVQNRSSQTVVQLNTFPVINAAVATTNIGALTKPLPAGDDVDVRLLGEECGIVHVYIGMADQSQLDATINTCARRDVIVVD